MNVIVRMAAKSNQIDAAEMRLDKENLQIGWKSSFVHILENRKIPFKINLISMRINVILGKPAETDHIV